MILLRSRALTQKYRAEHQTNNERELHFQCFMPVSNTYLKKSGVNKVCCPDIYTYVCALRNRSRIDFLPRKLQTQTKEHHRNWRNYIIFFLFARVSEIVCSLYIYVLRDLLRTGGVLSRLSCGIDLTAFAIGLLYLL